MTERNLTGPDTGSKAQSPPNILGQGVPGPPLEPKGLDELPASHLVAEDDGDDGLTPDEEKTLLELQAKAARAAAGEAGIVRMKVEPPHSEVTHANFTIGSDWTQVPAWLAPIMSNAAAAAGVKITQESES